MPKRLPCATPSLRQIWYEAKLVTKIELVNEEREVKGFVHPIYKLRLSLLDGTALDIAPNLPSFPMDYAGAEGARLLTGVQALSERYYVR